VRHKVYVVDTGYLLALFGVPGEASAEETKEVRRRFRLATDRHDECVVPLPVIYETASHINDIDSSREIARQFALVLLGHVRDAEAPDALFTVEPRPAPEEVEHILNLFANDHVLRGHSLADTALLDIATRLRHERDDRYHVHIWTWERRKTGIRSCSPDEEPDPFPPWSD